VDAVHGGKAVLGGESARHLRRVLRAEPGQRFEVSDNRSAWLAEVAGFGRDEVEFRLLEPLEEEKLPLRLFLFASLIKFDRFEWLIEKATELGAEAIVPVQAARSDKGLDRAAVRRVGRWRKIALESSQQSRRTRLPRIQDCLSLAEALKAEADWRCLLDEDRGATPLLAELPAAGARSSPDRVCLLTGPEGGWTEQERRAAIDAGWRCVSLGPLILRAETAAVAAMSALMCSWQRIAR